ncbi:MAG: flavodoxin domain-containing protein [Methanobacteriaceae archaeon]|jgi:flavodoxin|nr:flavodoxin domain-containing protein [Candidatus Methanorudis spinitermitis]
MKTIIIYYSESGNTRQVAKTLSSLLSTDLTEIKDIKSRIGFSGKISSAIDAFRENKTETIPPKVELKDYGLVYFGTPTWANNASPAIITIIDKCDLQGKDVVLFATMNGSGGISAINRMKEKVESRGARVVESFVIKTKNKNVSQIKKDSENIAKLLDLRLYL